MMSKIKKKPWNGPREKLLRSGAKSLTDIELLAIFLRTGKQGLSVMLLAEHLTTHFGSIRRLLSASMEEFRHIGGVGVATYTQLRAIAELGRRYAESWIEEEKPLLSPDMTREFLQSQLTDEEREVFMVIFMDNQHRVIKHSRLFSGTLSHVEVHPREIVREDIKVNAAAVILAHNHPSGRSEPSQADKAITERIIKCCGFMDIRVLDHLVIGRGEYVSFAERGWI